MAANTHVYTGRHVVIYTVLDLLPAKAPGATTAQMEPGGPSFGCWHIRKYAPCDLDYNRNRICSQKLRKSRRIVLFFFFSRTHVF